RLLATPHARQCFWMVSSRAANRRLKSGRDLTQTARQAETPPPRSETVAQVKKIEENSRGSWHAPPANASTPLPSPTPPYRCKTETLKRDPSTALSPTDHARMIAKVREPFGSERVGTDHSNKSQSWSPRRSYAAKPAKKESPAASPV